MDTNHPLNLKGVIFLVLFKNTKIFIDVKNMVVSYDAIVAMKIHEYFENNDGSRFFFKDEIDKLKNQDPKALTQNIMADKKNYNFLLDYFDWDVVNDERFMDINPLEICNRVYEETLQIDDFSQKVFGAIASGHLMTSIAQSFKLLFQDDALSVIYFYLGDNTPDYIIRGLNFFYMSSEKKKYVIGNKADFIRENPCNSYFIEKPEDIDEYFACPHNDEIEIYIPGSTVNTSVTEAVKGVGLRELTTEEPLSKYKEYNTNVYTLFLPI